MTWRASLNVAILNFRVENLEFFLYMVDIIDSVEGMRRGVAKI